MRFIFMFGRILALASALVGCSKPEAQVETVPAVTNDEEHNRCYKQAGNLVTPYFRISDRETKPSNTRRAQADLRRGIALYTAVVTYAPTNWNAWWLMGKAYQALGEQTNSCDAFGKAYAIQKDHPDVAREYTFSCLDLGRTSEAIAAAEHALSLEPQNAGLVANLALAYTIAGRIPEAARKVDESLAMDPNDTVTRSLKKVIREIQEGKRPQPKKYGDLSSQ